MSDLGEKIWQAVAEDDIEKLTLHLPGATPNDLLFQGKYHGKQMTALMIAARTGKVEMVNMLAKAGANVNEQDSEEGMTALMHASEKGRAVAAQTLVQLNADLNRQSKAGATALMLAAKHNRKETVDILLECGADRDLRDKDGNTAANVANDPDVKTLIEAHGRSSPPERPGATLSMYGDILDEADSALLDSFASIPLEDIHSEIIDRMRLYQKQSALHKFPSHDIPTLAVILPEVQQGWVSTLNPMNLVRENYRLFFLCANTLRPAKCGPKGEGYKIKLTRELVIKARPVLQVGLVMLKVALLASGLPLPFHVGQVDATLMALSRLPHEDLAIDLNQSAREAYTAIKTLLSAIDKNYLAHTGLRKVVNSRGEVAWVENTDAAEQMWKEKGRIASLPSRAASTQSISSEPNASTTKAGRDWTPEESSETFDWSELQVSQATKAPTLQSHLTMTNDESVHYQEILRRGSKPYMRSKLALLGQGDAGKTSLANALLGKVEERTESTPGILTCDMKLVRLGTRDGTAILCSEHQKSDREYAAAVAEGIVDAQHRKQKSMDKIRTAKNVAGNASSSAGDANSRTLSNKHINFGLPIRTDSEAADHGSDDATQKLESVGDEVTSGGLPESNHAEVINELGKIRNAPSGLVVSLFDYGGQEVFDMLHHLFLTRSGVYALVFNMEWLVSDRHNREKALSFLRKWLSSITAHTLHDGKTAPVVLVGTHLDRICDAKLHQHISNILFEELHSSLAWLSVIKNSKLVFFPVDNKFDGRASSIECLMTAVYAAMDAEESTREQVPLNWFKAMDALSDTKKDSLLLCEVESILDSIAIPKEEVWLLLAFLHNIGHLMWFKEPGLRDVVILNPISSLVEPATVIICKVFPEHENDDRIHFRGLHKKCQDQRSREFNQLYRKGVLNTEILPFLWGEYDSVLLQLMVKFGLLVPLHSALSEGQPTQYLVPSLLPAAPTEDKYLTDAWTDKPYITFYLVVTLVEQLHSEPTLSAADLAKYGFLPAAMFERIVGDALVWSQETTVDSYSIDLDRVQLHKDLAILSFGQQRFRLMPCEHIHSVRVDVEGSNPVGIEQRLVSIVKRNADSFMGALRVFSAVQFNVSHESPSETSLSLIPIAVLRAGANSSRASQKGIWKDGQQVLSAGEIPKMYPEWFPTLISSDNYDVFIPRTSTATDRKFVEQLFDAFTNFSVGEQHRAVKVFHAERSVCVGSSTSQETIEAMIKSSIALPVVSLESVKDLQAHNAKRKSPVLMEWILLLELFRHPKSKLRKVFPILLGENELFGRNGEIEARNAIEQVAEQLPLTEPTATLTHVADMLRLNGIQPSERMQSYTVFSVAQELLEFKAVSTVDVPPNRLVAAYAWGSVRILDEEVLVVPADLNSADRANAREGVSVTARERAKISKRLSEFPAEREADFSVDEASRIRQMLNHGDAVAAILRTFIDGTRDTPTLVAVFPEVVVNSAGALNAFTVIGQKYRLLFLCAKTHLPVRCGPQGEGYEVELTREWIVKALPVLQVGLVLLKMALPASGIPWPISKLSSMLSTKPAQVQFIRFAYGLITNPPSTIGPLEMNRIELGNAEMDASGIKLDKSAMESYSFIRSLLPIDVCGNLMYTGLRKQINRLGETLWMRDPNAFIGPNIGDKELIQLASEIARNGPSTPIWLANCAVSDLGIVSTCWALQKYHRSRKVELTIEGINYETILAHNLLNSLGPRVSFTPTPIEDLKEWRSYLKQQLSSDNITALRLLLDNFFSDPDPIIDHTYAAVIAAWLGDTDRALTCLEMFPEQSSEVLEECSFGAAPFQSPGCLGKRILDSCVAEKSSKAETGFSAVVEGSAVAACTQRADKKEVDDTTTATRADVAAVYAARVVAEAVHGRCAVSVVHIHLVGERWSGKKTLTRALKKCFGRWRCYWPFAYLEEEENCAPNDLIPCLLGHVEGAGRKTAVVLHKYDSVDNLSPLQCAQLADPHSVYLINLPLWDMRPGVNHDKLMHLADIVVSYRAWLKLINSLTAGSGGTARCVTLLNFAYRCQRERIKTVLYRLHYERQDFAQARACRIAFGEVLEVDANHLYGVRGKLVPILKHEVSVLVNNRWAYNLALQAVLVDMTAPGKWPLVCSEDNVKKLVTTAVRDGVPHLFDTAEVSSASQALRTVVDITLRIMQRRGDIVMIPSLEMHQRVCVRCHCELLVQLEAALQTLPAVVCDFNSVDYPHCGLTVALGASVDNHSDCDLLDQDRFGRLYTANEIEAAARLVLDSNPSVADDLGASAFIPLLQHTGTGFALVVDDPTHALFWLSILNRTVKAPGRTHAHETLVTPTAATERAEFTIERQFVLSNVQTLQIPPGYFPALFAGIINLNRNVHIVYAKNWKVEIFVGDEAPLWICITISVRGESFTVSVTSDSAHDSQAFEHMQHIRHLIYHYGWIANLPLEEKALLSEDVPGGLSIAGVEVRLSMEQLGPGECVNPRSALVTQTQGMSDRSQCTDIEESALVAEATQTERQLGQICQSRDVVAYFGTFNPSPTFRRRMCIYLNSIYHARVVRTRRIRTASERLRRSRASLPPLIRSANAMEPVLQRLGDLRDMSQPQVLQLLEEMLRALPSNGHEGDGRADCIAKIWKKVLFAKSRNALEAILRKNYLLLRDIAEGAGAEAARAIAEQSTAAGEVDRSIQRTLSADPDAPGPDGSLHSSAVGAVAKFSAATIAADQDQCQLGDQTVIAPAAHEDAAGPLAVAATPGSERQPEQGGDGSVDVTAALLASAPNHPIVRPDAPLSLAPESTPGANSLQASAFYNHGSVVINNGTMYSAYYVGQSGQPGPPPPPEQNNGAPPVQVSTLAEDENRVKATEYNERFSLEKMPMLPVFEDVTTMMGWMKRCGVTEYSINFVCPGCRVARPAGKTEDGYKLHETSTVVEGTKSICSLGAAAGSVVAGAFSFGIAPVATSVLAAGAALPTTPMNVGDVLSLLNRPDKQEVCLNGGDYPITNAHVDALQQLFELVGDPAEPKPPQFTRLFCRECSTTGLRVWVCEECSDGFVRLGTRCLRITFKFD